MDESPQTGLSRPRRIARRALLRGALGLAGASALLAACQAGPRPAPTAETRPTETARPVPTATAPLAQPVPPAKPTVAARPAVKAPKPGGTLIVAKTTEPTDLDPQLNPSLSRQRLTMLTYSNLVKLDGDSSIRPDLAESWRVSPDGKQIEFKLRQGVKWHPPVSREVTADDVKYSYERLLKESPGRADFAAIDGIEAADTYTLSFSLNAPNAGLLASMADSRWGAIVNRETVEKNGDLRKTAVGSGPFILEDWKPEQELKLRKNPEYFEKNKPYLDGLLLKIIPDEANIIAGLRARTIHHAMLEDSKNFELLKDDRSLMAYRAPRLGYDFFNFNQKVPPFDRPQVIQAINYAVDRGECIKAAAQGLAVLTAPCTPAMKQWQLDRTRWEPFYKVDLERARRLLAEAGYPNGFEATVLTIPTLSTMFANAQVVQANLKRIGIDLKVEGTEYAAWIRRWQAKDFQATLNTTNGYADPDLAFYRAFHSKAQNWNNIDNPELDKLLEQGRLVTEVDKRKPIYDQVQAVLLEKPGHLWLFTAEMIDFTQTAVQGFSQHPTTTLWSYADVWLDL